jgi:hypothetical protein
VDNLPPRQTLPVGVTLVKGIPHLEEFKVDKDRLRALHGNAVLSRYPIRSAKLVPFTVGYDWFTESRIRPLEKAKRKAAVLIGEDLLREVRRGQRTTLFAELDVPEAPGQVVTVVSTHLENRAKPKIRRQQMDELLKEIHAVSGPVIVAGDLNTTGSDATPTSVERMLYKRYGSADFWTTKGVQWATGVGLIYTGAKAIRSLSKIAYRIDPTSANIRGASPNLERGLFSTIERFRFADGDVFDFRGVPGRTVNGTAGTLADSNQRKRGGFVPTFVTELIWGKVRIARFKLDWIFIKADLENPRDRKGTYRLAPALCPDLERFEQLSARAHLRHSPMIVGLPFQEPKLAQQKVTQ